ncbi:MAG: hypothetical protein GY751_04440 [Bacteroidetes bacterium]|nr:hypothetical protein [Bacteroidota bacterium]
MKAILTFLISLLMVSTAFSQDQPDSIKVMEEQKLLLIDTTIKADISIGLELQGYPTGINPGLHIDVTFNNRNAMIFRLGYNWFNHRDLGVHDSETGYGLGFSMGYRRYFEEEGLKGFFIGARSDFWFSKVKWTENVDNDRKKDILISSKSDVVVLQPVIEVGYKLKSPDSRFAFVPFLGFGYEWNVSEQGHVILDNPLPPPAAEANLSEETGDGFIFLAGFAFTLNVGRSDQRRWSDR